ncbi:molybdopterin-dependent oxidoreductase [Mycobacterium sp. Aquia_216]|uniref:molybdopterin oxidoreductase family protein n=1 Tax=Mycobacterium sp. Aquia_216 TaxID=2991729 RepID=UPI00227D5739|nr:molybdopterin-dependent oxidoreductase [Mycobacterium sp. Aquia_216]WAJ43031.1 molybdopterin-dependent oxidoreductase [Mycobacterium sp. Aquia_216]
MTTPIRQIDTTTIETQCPYCALQCGMKVTAPATPDGLLTIAPRPFPTSGGGLCSKGWNAAEPLKSPDRLTQPLMRRQRRDALRPVTWDEALDYVAERIIDIQQRHGRDAVAALGSGGLAHEKAYMLGKFARVALATRHVDSAPGRFCMSSAAFANNRSLGLDRGLPFPLTDVGEADAVLLIGANVAASMPPFTQHLARAIRSGGLVVVDPRRTPTADKASLHLQPSPGTDLALALGMFHAVIEQGLADHDFLEERTHGFDAAWRVASQWWPERAEQATGVPAAEQRRAVRLLAEAANAYVLTARGTEQHSSGVDMVTGWINLALALGLPGRHGSGYGCITGQSNGQGAREHGQKPDQLPGYRKLVDPDARAHVAKVWGVDPDDLPSVGLTSWELIDSIGTPEGPKAIISFGSNLAVTAPNSAVVEARFDALEFLVVSDMVPSETVALADVVFPVGWWSEEDNTITNLEGRVLLRRKVVEPPSGVKSDLDVMHGIAVRLGQPAERFPTAPQRVFDELATASAGGTADYSGINYDRLSSGDGIHWPCPGPGHPGTPRMFLDRFGHPDGRARLVAVDHVGPAEPTDADYPLIATSGRVMEHYQSGSLTRRVLELMKSEPECFVEVHPETASSAGLSDGDLTLVESRRGAVTARVRCVTTLRPNTVFLPFHFPGAGRANLITNPVLDPLSKMPEFKVSAVRLKPVALSEDA